MQKLAASESSVRSLEGSLNTSSKEKEEMALVLHKLLLIIGSHQLLSISLNNIWFFVQYIAATYRCPSRNGGWKVNLVNQGKSFHWGQWKGEDIQQWDMQVIRRSTGGIFWFTHCP